MKNDKKIINKKLNKEFKKLIDEQLAANFIPTGDRVLNLPPKDKKPITVAAHLTPQNIYNGLTKMAQVLMSDKDKKKQMAIVLSSIMKNHKKSPFVLELIALYEDIRNH